VKFAQSSFSIGADKELWYDEENFTQGASGAAGSGTTSYSSEDSSIATVDASTGEVSIIGTGSVTITASNPGDDTYAAATVSYSLKVKAPFTTTWETTATNEMVTIPTLSSYTYDYTVDWGDGSSDSNLSENASHTYSSAGVHTIKISRDFPSIYFNGGGDKEKILSIEQWGDIDWQSFLGSFNGCSALEINAPDTPDLSGVTDISYMFKDCSSLNSDLNNWDVSTIQNFGYLFQNATSFNGDISSWNVSNATDMRYMFFNAVVFNQDISNWNVFNVTNFSTMFRSAKKFNRDIGNWVVSKATIMNSMFYDAESFNQDISSWDVSKVSYFSWMFADAWVFNCDIGGWNVTKANSGGLSKMFLHARKFNQDLNLWTFPDTTDLSNMFNGATDFNGDISSWDVSNITNFKSMFDNATSFNGDISSWSFSTDSNDDINMNQMFFCASVFNADVSGWNTERVTDMNYMFKNALAFSNNDLSSWNVSNVPSDKHTEFSKYTGGNITEPTWP